jgi:hypothetical protein
MLIHRLRSYLLACACLGLFTTEQAQAQTRVAYFPLYKKVTGQLRCEAGDGPGAIVTNDLAHLTVEIQGFQAVTDPNGNFEINGPFGWTVGDLTLRYVSDVTTTSGVRTRLAIVDDLLDGRSEAVDRPVGSTSGDTLNLGTITVPGGDCEIWRIGVELLDDYHALMGASPPTGQLRIKRWSAIQTGIPHVIYDYIVLTTNWVETAESARDREGTLFHEFGHTIRHTADGDSGHWTWDLVRWAYGRIHSGQEVTNIQFAFNEGWGSYWRANRVGGGISMAGVPGTAYRDWNELRVAQRLLDLSNASGSAFMVDALLDNPGAIHSLYQFEQAYCGAIPLPNPFCTSAGRPVRPNPDDTCPPNYHNDGATCRFDNIRAKPSYGRGAGSIPTRCDSGEENDAGLCYPTCSSGYDGVGPVCWQRCPSGYQDDGVFCRRDGRIIASNNSACPWHDVCGLFNRCSTCPAGYHNDGCTCRRDPHIFAKSTYGRGVGEIPDRCSTGQEYDAGLCYPSCNSGYDGVGPVCWGSCPSGFADHGATCYRDPNVFTKY